MTEGEPLGSVVVADLKDGRARTFPFRDALGLADEAIVLRVSGVLHVFVNRCPHWKIALASESGDFFDVRTGTIVCERHGARFDPLSGLCVSGPAEGRLERLPFRLEGERIVVEPVEREWVDD